MRNKKIFGLLVIAVFNLFLLSSCKKETSSPETLSDKDKLLPNSSSREIDPECQISFTDELIDSIGLQHNRLVRETYDQYLVDNQMTLLTALNNSFSNNRYDTLTHSDYEDLYGDYNETDVATTIESTIDTISNSVQKQILEDMVELVKTTSSYDALYIELSALKKYTIENLDCFEETSTLVALEVCINSAKLWYPVEDGGEGYLDHISNSNGSRNMQQYRTSGFWSFIGRVVCSDAMGAFTGVVRAALPYFASGGPANPISNAAIAASAIVQGASSSAISAISQAGH